MNWLLYGANGYTGRLILAEALRRGLRPVVAGRAAAELAALAGPAGLEHRAFPLERAETGLHDIGLVLHCAGPFSETARPMVEACLARGAHYVDITGEIDVFAWCHAQHERAVARGVVLVPGSGFDVVPTDCVAATLAAELPGASRLALVFEAGGGASRGTSLTSVEGLRRPGLVRRGGQLTEVPLAWKTRSFSRNGKPRAAMTVPWGDVYTAFVTTGIPDIEVYMTVSPRSIRRLRRLRLLAPLLATAPVQRWLKSRVAARQGPDAALRADTDAWIRGEAEHPDGRRAACEIVTPNGYDLTVTAALGIVQSLLAGSAPAGGYYTPARLMGQEYAFSLPGVRRIPAV